MAEYPSRYPSEYRENNATTRENRYGPPSIRSPLVHSKKACGGSFRLLALDLTYYFNNNRASEVIPRLEECLERRDLNSQRFGGYNEPHAVARDLISNLGQFLFGYIDGGIDRFPKINIAFLENPMRFMIQVATLDESDKATYQVDRTYAGTLVGGKRRLSTRHRKRTIKRSKSRRHRRS